MHFNFQFPANNPLGFGKFHSAQYFPEKGRSQTLLISTAFFEFDESRICTRALTKLSVIPTWRCLTHLPKVHEWLCSERFSPNVLVGTNPTGLYYMGISQRTWTDFRRALSSFTWQGKQKKYFHTTYTSPKSALPTPTLLWFYSSWNELLDK